MSEEYWQEAFEIALDEMGLFSVVEAMTKEQRAEIGKALEGFGVKVIGMRHHSENFIVEANAEGFPVWMLPAPPSPTPDAGGDRG